MAYNWGYPKSFENYETPALRNAIAQTYENIAMTPEERRYRNSLLAAKQGELDRIPSELDWQNKLRSNQELAWQQEQEALARQAKAREDYNKLLSVQPEYQPSTPEEGLQNALANIAAKYKGGVGEQALTAKQAQGYQPPQVSQYPTFNYPQDINPAAASTFFQEKQKEVKDFEATNKTLLEQATKMESPDAEGKRGDASAIYRTLSQNALAQARLTKNPLMFEEARKYDALAKEGLKRGYATKNTLEKPMVKTWMDGDKKVTKQWNPVTKTWDELGAGQVGVTGTVGKNVWASTGVEGVSRNRATNEFVIPKRMPDGTISNTPIDAQELSQMARLSKEGKSAASQAGGSKTAALYRANDLFQSLAPKLKAWKAELQSEDESRLLKLVTSVKSYNELTNKIESAFRDNPTQAKLIKNTVLLADALSTVYGAGPGGKWSFEVAKAMLDPMPGIESFNATLDSHGEKIQESLASAKAFPKSVPLPTSVIRSSPKELSGRQSFTPTPNPNKPASNKPAAQQKFDALRKANLAGGIKKSDGKPYSEQELWAIANQP